MSIIEKALDKRRSSQPKVPPDTKANLASGDPPAGDLRAPPVAPAAAQAASEHPVRTSKQINIDFGWLRRQGIMVPGEKRSSLAEQYRHLKRPILNNAFGRQSVTRVPKGRMIMVTSSLPKEGKTFTSINLALSMALEVDRTVLLVDADVARPALPRTLGFEADRGLMDVLTDPGIEIPDVLLRTNIPNLTILPAGRFHAQSTELLASSAMVRLLEDLHNRYQDRIILFDSPPLLVTSESGVLATQMGQVIMVVEADNTPASSVERAMEQLEGCDVVLTLLNKSTSVPGQSYGGGYYYSSQEQDSTKAEGAKAHEG